MNTQSKSSIRSLIFVNLTVIVFAVLQDWSMSTILWSYWMQSVIIGLFQYKKIMDLKKFSTEGMKQDGVQIENTQKEKRKMAHFFLFHYGAFHAAYLLFLNEIDGILDWTAIAIAAGLFFANHFHSYIENRSVDSSRNIPHLGTMVAIPYLRIMPMHLLIAFAAGQVTTTFWLIVFLLMKTVADVVMHKIEHSKKKFHAKA